MLVLIVALGSQVAAPCPHAGRAAGEADAGWGFYRRGGIAEAAAHFAAADSLCPGDHGAQVGLGFVGLRQGESRAAADHFLGAVRSNAGDAEAWYGLGLARVRLGQRSAAADAWRHTLRLTPGYEDAELQLLALGIDSGLALPAVVRPVDPEAAVRTAGEGFEIRTQGGWRPFYVKGINLGVALPGHFPSEFPTDDSTNSHWLALIAGARANAIRVYTILPPAFYRSLRAWNDAHPDRALWLLHGVWTELPPRDDYDGVAWQAGFRAEMRRVVDLLHGHTLAPLSHPTEPTLEEEQRLRRRHGFPPNPRLKEYDNDRESLDAMLVRATSANLAGYFASYHAYPYYPDFIDLDSAYGAVGSAEGRSRYFGYLRGLTQHHAGRPLLIAEYGVPSSRGVSHLQADGMGHGGHDERAMADIDARLTREVRAAGAAGGVLVAWLDEWFKHTWVTIDLEVPAERSRLWHNVEDAEQHYGLMGEYGGASGDATPAPGGDPAVWRALPVLARADSLVLRVGADPSYLYVALAGRPAVEWARYAIGIDTYRRDRGPFRRPGVAGGSR